MSDAPKRTPDDQVVWGIPSHGEPRWRALPAVAVAIALQLVLPERVIRGLGSRWLIPGFEMALLLVLLIANPGRISKEERRLRIVGVSLIALISVANVVTLLELINALLYGSKAAGRPLIYASLPIWLTNVIVFGLWYWELDRGGPAERQLPGHRRPDFLFPQMSTPGSGPGWDRACSTTSTRRSPTHRLQPDRHHAPHRLGQVAHVRPSPGVAGYGRFGHFARREHLELTRTSARHRYYAFGLTMRYASRDRSFSMRR
jgi:hypothetical protein